MSVYLSFYEVLLDPSGPRETIGSGSVESVLARRSRGPGLRLFLQEPPDPPTTRMRTGKVQIHDNRMHWLEKSDPHIRRGAWVRLLGVGPPVFAALRARWQSGTGVPTGSMAWDSTGLEAIGDEEAVRRLAFASSAQVLIVEMSLSPDHLPTLLDWVCGAGASRNPKP